MKNYVTVIIVAAGNSSRMGLATSKQFIPLLEQPAIQYTLTAFERSYLINSIVVVCRPQDEIAIRTIIDNNNIKKVDAIVYGGSTRSESVLNGIKASNDETTHFAIHDGARPLIELEDIEKVVKGAFETGCATLGTYVTDTIKTVDEEGYISSTLTRSKLRAVQTPQVFEKNLYLNAFNNAMDSKLDFTDDCQLLENYGAKVKVIIGNTTNIKLTTQSDIIIAENILKRKQETL